MNATEAQIEERFPVWDALSDFFLDTSLQADDYKRIAKTLAATRFTESEIEEILVCEVCPVCRWNLASIAGEWAGFNPEWLKTKITPRIGKTVKFKALFRLRHQWMYKRHWGKVRKLVAEIRMK